MSKFCGKVVGRWFDPTSGQYPAIAGSPFDNSGRREFAAPAKNASGDGDWVLLLEVAP